MDIMNDYEKFRDFVQSNEYFMHDTVLNETVLQELFKCDSGLILTDRVRDQDDF